MVIHVVSIGKTNVDFVEQALNEYLNRLKHYAKVNWIELPDAKKVDRKNEMQVKEAEGKLFEQQIQPNWRIILLDDKGKEFSSEAFAEWINQHMIYQQQDLCFLIGGAYGFSETIKNRSSMKLSLSQMTFNHQMVRMIFAEQLYRAFSIIKGEPYHHA